MKLRDVFETLNRLAPLSFQESWDCSGWVLGEPTRDVRGLAFALEASPWTVRGALELGADALILHHPPLFGGVTALDFRRAVHRALIEAVKNDLALLAWHTSWDVAPQGVNACFGQALGVPVHGLSALESGAFLGGWGQLDEPLSVRELASRLAQKLGLSGWRQWGDGPVTTVAWCGGAGSELFQAAADVGAELFITSELKRHHIAQARYAGLRLIEVDHGESEEATMKVLADLMGEKTKLPTFWVRGPEGERPRWFCTEDGR